ncbi:MAG: HlyC/CorC family transporter [Clostridia bacterium]|nr:HlyC/CorC family transporter [Clostridia bacterium]
MDANGTLTIAILVLLVLCSAFFSSAETAYTALNQVRLKNMAASGNKRAEKVLSLAENYDKLISSILIGNNIVNILASALATVFFVQMLGSSGVTVSTIVMTIAVLLFGEVTPKTIARILSDRLVFIFYPVLNFIVHLLTPLNFLMGQWQKLIGKLVRRGDGPSVTEEELITMVEEAESDGEIDEHESELIRSAIEFNDITVEDILTPRVEITAVHIHDSTKDIAAKFAESGYSRLPVYEDNMDDIVGILHEKDFYRNRSHLSVAQMMRKPICVLPSTRLSDMLKLLQRSKSHMAVVVDEYGGVTGIVTLEDILEELVGEIWDEHDEVVEEFQKLPDGSWRVECSAGLDDFLELFQLDKEYDSVTVNGWVLEEIGAFPQPGDTFECENLHVTIERVDKRRVEQIRVEVNSKQLEEQ